MSARIAPKLMGFALGLLLVFSSIFLIIFPDTLALAIIAPSSATLSLKTNPSRVPICSSFNLYGSSTEIMESGWELVIGVDFYISIALGQYKQICSSSLKYDGTFLSKQITIKNDGFWIGDNHIYSTKITSYRQFNFIVKSAGVKSNYVAVFASLSGSTCSGGVVTEGTDDSGVDISESTDDIGSKIVGGHLQNTLIIYSLPDNYRHQKPSANAVHDLGKTVKVSTLKATVTKQTPFKVSIWVGQTATFRVDGATWFDYYGIGQQDVTSNHVAAWVITESHSEIVAFFPVEEDQDPQPTDFYTLHQSSTLKITTNILRGEVSWIPDFSQRAYDRLTWNLDISNTPLEMKIEKSSFGGGGRYANDGKFSVYYSNWVSADHNAKGLIIHEMANTMATTYEGSMNTAGWSGEWWANGKSPFGVMSSIVVMQELGYGAEAQERKNTFKNDPLVLMHMGWQEAYGWTLYKKTLQALKEDGVTLGGRDLQEERLKSHYLAFYLDHTGGVSVLSDLRSTGILVDDSLFNELEEAYSLLEQCKIEIGNDDPQVVVIQNNWSGGYYRSAKLMAIELLGTEEGATEITITSSPDTGAVGQSTIVIDGTPYSAPFTTRWSIGSTHTIQAVSSISSGNNIWTFDSWSDHGARTHSVIIPSSPMTYTAYYYPVSASPSNIYSVYVNDHLVTSYDEVTTESPIEVKVNAGVGTPSTMYVEVRNLATDAKSNYYLTKRSDNMWYSPSIDLPQGSYDVDVYVVSDGSPLRVASIFSSEGKSILSVRNVVLGVLFFMGMGLIMLNLPVTRRW